MVGIVCTLGNIVGVAASVCICLYSWRSLHMFVRVACVCILCYNIGIRNIDTRKILTVLHIMLLIQV